MANNPDNFSHRQNRPRDPDWVLDALSGSALPPLRSPRWRCRPDGRHRWIRLELAPAAAARLRVRARAEGVGVDAWLGIALAMREALVEIGSSVLQPRLRAAIAAGPEPVAGERRIRAWQRYLAERDAPGVRDELPEVVLPESIPGETVRRHAPAAPALSPDLWDLGRRCEIGAAGRDIPLPAYIRGLADAR
jgi:hypothetical protein